MLIRLCLPGLSLADTAEAEARCREREAITAPKTPRAPLATQGLPCPTACHVQCRIQIPNGPLQQASFPRDTDDLDAPSKTANPWPLVFTTRTTTQQRKHVAAAQATKQQHKHTHTHNHLRFALAPISGTLFLCVLCTSGSTLRLCSFFSCSPLSPTPLSLTLHPIRTRPLAIACRPLSLSFSSIGSFHRLHPCHSLLGSPSNPIRIGSAFHSFHTHLVKDTKKPKKKRTISFFIFFIFSFACFSCCASLTFPSFFSFLCFSTYFQRKKNIHPTHPPTNTPTYTFPCFLSSTNSNSQRHSTQPAT